VCCLKIPFIFNSFMYMYTEKRIQLRFQLHAKNVRVTMVCCLK
jgi:hypothetical protein